jgi:predicted transposase YdaD
MLPAADKPKWLLAEELVVGLLLCKLSQLDRQEFQKMFKLADIRKSRVWREAHEDGIEKGALLKQQEIVRCLVSKGKKPKEIAELLEIPIAEVRRLAKRRDA